MILVLGVIADVVARACSSSLVVAAGAPLLVGVLRTLKARLVGRRGSAPLAAVPPICAKLLRQGGGGLDDDLVGLPRDALSCWWRPCWSPPSIVPVVASRPPLAFAGNIILLMYLFMLGTFFLALAGLDAGSAFGGMGASREVAVAALAEPTVIVAVFALALRADTIDLGGIVERLGREPCLAANPGHLLAFAAFFIVMLAETGRLPGGQSGDAPRAHDDPRGDGARVLGPLPGARRVGRGDEALPLHDAAGQPLLPLGPRRARVAPVPILLGLHGARRQARRAHGRRSRCSRPSVAKLRLFRVPELLAGSFALAFLSVMAVFLVR